MASPTTSERHFNKQVSPSKTAQIVCAMRAAETLRPPGRRIIDDPYAKHFLTNGRYRLLTANRLTAALSRSGFERLYPGWTAIVLLRNRWYETSLTNALADGITQIVLLGAGYDTTSLRLGLGGATLFEVDAPPTQQTKREIIRRRGLPDHAVRYVQCDLEGDSLSERLRDNGFDRNTPSLIAWWGVSFYLTEHAIHRTISEVASMTAPGSRFMFDYLDPGVVDGTTVFPGARRGGAAVARRGEPYTFGLKRDQAGQLLNSFGFEVETNLSITELAQRYDRFAYRADDFCSVITGKRVTR